MEDQHSPLADSLRLTTPCPVLPWGQPCLQGGSQMVKLSWPGGAVVLGSAGVTGCVCLGLTVQHTRHQGQKLQSICMG